MCPTTECSSLDSRGRARRPPSPPGAGRPAGPPWRWRPAGTAGASPTRWRCGAGASGPPRSPARSTARSRCAGVATAWPRRCRRARPWPPPSAAPRPGPPRPTTRRRGPWPPRGQPARSQCPRASRWAHGQVDRARGRQLAEAGAAPGAAAPRRAVDVAGGVGGARGRAAPRRRTRGRVVPVGHDRGRGEVASPASPARRPSRAASGRTRRAPGTRAGATSAYQSPPPGPSIPRSARGPRPGPPKQERVEDTGRRDVEEDLREVLAADQVHVVHPEVDGRHLVARGAARSPSTRRSGAGGRAARRRRSGRPARWPRRRGTRRRRRRRTRSRARRSHISGDRLCMTGVRDRTASSMLGSAEHAQAGAELGHRGPVARHRRHPPTRAARLAAAVPAGATRRRGG